MKSQLFKNFIRKSILRKQGAPGPAPRPGLRWKPSTHRWIRGEGTAQERVLSTGSAGNQQIYTDPTGKGKGYGADLYPSGPDSDYGTDSEEDYWADFNIDDHKKAIGSYVKTAMGDYLKENYESMRDTYSSDEIKSSVVQHILEGSEDTLGGGILEDLDIVVPNDEEALDNAMESIHDTVRDSIEQTWESGETASKTKNFFRGLAGEYNTSELQADFQGSRDEDDDRNSKEYPHWETKDFYSWLGDSIRDDLWSGKFEDKLEGMGMDSQNEKELEGFLESGIRDYAKAQGDIKDYKKGYYE